MDDLKVQQILEAAIFAADTPLNRQALIDLFDPGFLDVAALARHLEALSDNCAERGIELREVASGFRFQVKKELGPWVSRMWQEKPPRYSRALLETLALIAYRQPVTRGEIEEVRGVTVSSQIVKTLLERGWVRVVGHRDVPGRPAMYATTRQFLDYFDLSSLDQLPTLADIRDLDEINRELALEGEPEEGVEAREPANEDIMLPPVEPGDVLASDEEQQELARVDAVLADFDSQFKRQPNTTEQEAEQPPATDNETDASEKNLISGVGEEPQ